jgi:KUP system potassium uptake protein
MTDASPASPGTDEPGEAGRSVPPPVSGAVISDGRVSGVEGAAAVRTGQPEGGERPTAVHRGSMAGLALGALGVVFGDIGTSPLYSVETMFAINDNAVKPTIDDVYGIVSLIFWSLTLIVTIKYVTLVMRADNDGEGGIMALAALVQKVLAPTVGRQAVGALMLGVLGASLFYGDSLITPAISVLSAVEGLEVAEPELADAVLPVSLVILALLFAAQRWGTHRVRRMFGPVMVLWFGTLAVLGIPHILAHPGVLRGLSPTYIVAFVVDHPFVAFIAMGAVVLVITGAEALYADLGHFGRRPIQLAWFGVAFPALVLNYLGQAALIINDPTAISNPFYLLAPGWARFPLVVLATFATVIASQAVISGAFSMSQQAVRLGFLPQVTIRHTSSQESGQVYLPAVNWLLFAGVLVLIAVFQSSQRLATAYGLAVTGTLLLTTTLFLTYAATAWRWPWWKLALVAVVIGGLELTFLAGNLSKIVYGGWLPLLVAAVVVTVMTTWYRGQRIISARRIEREGRIPEFVEQLRAEPAPRVRGTAVFPHLTKETVPLGLRANLEFNHVLHDRVVIVSALTAKVPHVPLERRFTVDDLGDPDGGIFYVAILFGFRDERDVPAMLDEVGARYPMLGCDFAGATYFLSRITILRGDEPGMSTWRKRLFVWLSHNAANPTTYFHLPLDRTMIMGSRFEL